MTFLRRYTTQTNPMFNTPPYPYTEGHNPWTGGDFGEANHRLYRNLWKRSLEWRLLSAVLTSGFIVYHEGVDVTTCRRGTMTLDVDVVQNYLQLKTLQQRHMLTREEAIRDGNNAVYLLLTTGEGLCGVAILLAAVHLILDQRTGLEQSMGVRIPQIVFVLPDGHAMARLRCAAAMMDWFNPRLIQARTEVTFRSVYHVAGFVHTQRFQKPILKRQHPAASESIETSLVKS